MPPVVARCLALIPAAMISALIVLNTFSNGHHLVSTPAPPASAWRSSPHGASAPLIVVIVLGAAVTALVRAIA